MTFPVKSLNSDQTGAPTLTGQAGSLIALLDACLINGFNLKTLDSLVVASNVATGTVSAGHGYKVGEIILIAGATPSGLNGEQKVVSVTASTFTFSTTESDTTATGTITAKIAPVGGWSKAYTGTNTAVYRSDDVSGIRHYLRVFDNYAGSGTTRLARVRAYEAMTDVDTGTGPIPTVADASGDGMVVQKSYTTDSTQRPWGLVGDGKLFYFFPYHRGDISDPSALYSRDGGCFAFGEMISFRPSDAYHTMLIANEDDTTYSQPPYQNNYFCNVGGGTSGEHSNGHWVARRFDQTGSPIRFAKCGETVIQTLMGYQGIPYPGPVDGGLWIAPLRIYEKHPTESKAHIRGRLPGLYQILHDQPLNRFDIVNGITDLPDRDLICFELSRATSWNQDGQCLVDITGPWR